MQAAFLTLSPRLTLNQRLPLTVEVVLSPALIVVESQPMKTQKLDKYNSQITEPKSQGGSQAIFHGVGLFEDDMSKPRIGISTVWHMIFQSLPIILSLSFPLFVREYSLYSNLLGAPVFFYGDWRANTKKIPHFGQQRVANRTSKKKNGSSSSNVSVPHFGSTLNQPFALKLDRNNFSLWKTMVKAIARGHRLDGYLTGARTMPDEYLPAPDAEGQPGIAPEINPEFEPWIVNDQLLMGWLYGSMTEGIATEIMGCSSSAELWSSLEALFGAHSKAKMDEYRTKIQTVRKGSMSMVDYLKQKKQWSDVLTLAGDPYPESLLVSNVLSGLDIEYLPIVLQIEAREKTTWQMLQDLLLSFDSKLDRLSSLSENSKHSNNASPTANLANKSGSGNYNPGNNNNKGRGGSSSNSRGRFNGRGRSGRGGPKPTCQVCGRYGHSAAYCYNRFDETFMGTTPPGNTGDNNKSGQNATAFVATPEMLQDDAWYANSGASNHVTSEAANLNQKTKYNGKDSLTVGDGSKLLIKHTGSGFMSTNNSSPLILKEMLHVPKIAKNLVSISKLTADNNVTVEFSSNDCCVKDNQTKKKVLQGKLKEGLYQFNSHCVKSSTKNPATTRVQQPKSTCFSALSTNLSSNVTQSVTESVSSFNSIKDRWRRKLGHPSSHVMNLVLNQMILKVPKLMNFIYVRLVNMASHMQFLLN
uniref:Retrovirus-related Pol polyprotein from transposon TNT 1-94-like beta-barrel domain-containing protein n=1 Tax=Cannabis sativa TaxID=3483 RepID=A0A803QD97_CANSA